MHAHTGLGLLRKSYVRRTSPAEGSALASLTILAEEVAVPLGENGAATGDLIDAIAFLRLLEGEEQPELCSSIPYLEARLAAAAPQPAA